MPSPRAASSFRPSSTAANSGRCGWAIWPIRIACKGERDGNVANVTSEGRADRARVACAQASQAASKLSVHPAAYDLLPCLPGLPDHLWSADEPLRLEDLGGNTKVCRFRQLRQTLDG